MVRGVDSRRGLKTRVLDGELYEPYFIHLVENTVLRKSPLKIPALIPFYNTITP